MESLTDIVARQQQASPEYFDDPDKERMMAIILSLAEEVCVLRDRLDTCRRLAERDDPATEQNVDAFAVPESVQQQRLDAHTAFFAATLAGLLGADD